MQWQHVTIVCFAASYALAFGLEMVQLFWPKRMLRYLAVLATAAGLLAHTIFLVARKPPLASQTGTLLTLAWILAVFSMMGSLHHRRLTWGLFVLPVALLLVFMAAAFRSPATGQSTWAIFSMDGDEFWRQVHVGLFVLAAVGICVGFVASCMYLVQAWRVRSKTMPAQGVRLWSMERLEAMNQHAIGLAFPLLTAGILLSLVRMLRGDPGAPAWSDRRIVTTVMLWLLFGTVLGLRLVAHLRGRRFAIFTIVAFFLLLLSLAVSHQESQGGTP